MHAGCWSTLQSIFIYRPRVRRGRLSYYKDGLRLETEQLPARETIYFNKRLAFIDQLPLFL